MSRERQKTFLMIDGSNLLFRAFYAIRNLTTAEGVSTNGVYGFLMMYLKAVELVHPDYIMVAFDRAGGTFRTEEYADYKGTRQKTPDELSIQFGMTKDLLAAMNVHAVDVEGYEADDIIGTVALRAAQQGMRSVLLTGDRDYFQLVDENTTVLFTKKGISQLEVVDEAWIQEQYGLRPADLIEVKGLQGDASDHIPGVAGVGEKTALKLVREYGTIENIYAHLDELSGKKLKQNLMEGETQAYLSRKIGTIFRDVPMEESMDDFVVREVDQEKLTSSLERLEFYSFADRFHVEGSKAQLVADSERISDEGWEDLAQRLRTEALVGFQILPEEPHYMQSKAALCAFASEDHVYILPLEGHEAAFRSAFEGLFRSEVTFLSYDIKASIVLLHRLGIDFDASYIDVMLMEYLLDPGRSSYEPAALASRVLSRSMKTEEEVFGKGKSRKTVREMDEETLDDYLASCLMAIRDAHPILEQQVRDLGMEELFQTIENPLALVLAHMEIEGVCIDQDQLDVLDRDFSAALERYEHEVYEAAGETFNLNSPKQLGELLFETLGLPHGKKTKTGYSTNADVLEKLRGAHPVVDAILNYRKLAKLKSTYVDGLRPHIGSDGRIHSTFRQNVAATGRISSTEPNLQNIPVRTEEGRKLRGVIVAGSGAQLVDADYSQIELRILASLSGDQAMIQAFRDGEDIHRKTAAEVNHIAPEEVSALQRSHAKAVNFGIIYGISDYGLSRDLNISRAEAKAYIDGYKDSYPEIRSYMESVVQQAKQDGYVTTYFGRRRNIPELTSKNYNLRGFGERVALNTPIQGTAADIIKRAMIRVDRALRDSNFRARLVLQIHDELIVEAPEEEANEVGALLVSLMEDDTFAVRLTCEMKIGHSWLETK